MKNQLITTYPLQSQVWLYLYWTMLSSDCYMASVNLGSSYKLRKSLINSMIQMTFSITSAEIHISWCWKITWTLLVTAKKIYSGLPTIWKYSLLMSCFLNIGLTGQLLTSENSLPLLQDTNSSLKICSLFIFCYKKTKSSLKKEVSFSMNLLKDFTHWSKIKTKFSLGSFLESSLSLTQKILLKIKS